MNKICALWKYTEWWASSRSNGFQNKFFKTLYTFKHTIEQSMRSVKVQRVMGFKQKQGLPEEVFQNIIHIQTYNWTKYALCGITLTGGIQAEALSRIRNFFKTLYTFKHTIDQSMRSVKVQWVVGFKQKQGLPGEVFQNIVQFQTYNWKKCALFQSNKVTWVVGFKQKRWLSEEVYETLYTCKHRNEQNMRSVKVHRVVGFKQKQWLSEQVFQNTIHIQTYNWTKYALCESTASDGLQSEAMAFRRSFSTHYTHSNIQLNKVCALWKSSVWWASSRSKVFQKKFFKTLFTFKHTNEQNMRSVEVHWLVGFKQKQWLA